MKIGSKKLTLSKETIRALGAHALNGVVGGTGYGGTGGGVVPTSALAGCNTASNGAAFCATRAACPGTQPGGITSVACVATGTCGCATGCCNATATCAGRATCGYNNTCGGYATSTC